MKRVTRDKRKPQVPNGVPLTNPFLPKLKIVKAVRHGRFCDKHQEAYMPQEDTAWWDQERDVIFYAEAGRDITDFASTPAGDGAKGYLRFGGRLHDLMCAETPVLVPVQKGAKEKLIKAIAEKKEGEYFTVMELIMLGWGRERLNLSIWDAAKVYQRILSSLGFPGWRATLHRVGLRIFQGIYRWFWAAGTLELVDDPTWRNRNGYFKNGLDNTA